MNRFCPQENQAAEATRTGRWTPELDAHLVDCADCADLALVGRWLRASEEPANVAVDLAQAERIWRRADEERRYERVAKALLPVRLGELSACLVGGGALLGFAVPRGAWLAQGAERLVSDPLISLLGTVSLGLFASVLLVSIVLTLGVGAARS